jgi:hypothetical protein
MAQDLTVNIKTTSDVPQAMDKAKAATGSFDKQVQDIGMKFKNSFKDIALGFIAPMIILQGAISMISNALAKAKQDAQDGIDLIAKGETVYASTEEKKMAAFFKAKKAREEEMRLTEIGEQEITRAFLESDAGKKFLEDESRNRPEGASRRQMNPNVAIHYESVRQAALKAFLESEEGKAYKPIFDKEGVKKDTAFKGPEGFGSVIGVGANPVVEAMTRQTEVLEEIKAVLESQRSSGGVPPPFTEKPMSTRTIFNA